jgi:flagellar hook-associated protein 1 FlgK
MSLDGSISISLRALLANQAALDNVSNNIANINTPGYARRRVVMEEGATYGVGLQTQPGGVDIQKVESIRDKVLELRTLDEVQNQTRDQALADTLGTVETLFGEGTGYIGNEVNSFFSAVSQLTTDPNNAALRQSVLTSASNVADSVKNTYQQLASAQQNVDRNVVQIVQAVNQLTSQIAAINVQVANKEKLGQDPGSLADQRGELIRQLSGLIDVSSIDSGDGLTLTTSSGSPLVVGDKSYNLTLGVNQSGNSDVFSDGKNITSKLTGGKLAGLLDARDNRLAGLMNKLDTFANSFANAVNTAHQAGFDANGNPGQNLFVAPTQVAGAAASMAVAISDPQLIAASSAAGGGNGNLQNLLGVKNQPIANGMTPSSFYSSMVFDIGDQVQNAQADADAGNLLVTQLDDQRGAISGVSLDEEATNLIRYQKAFQAAARVIDVVNQLSETVINMGR